MFVMVEDFAKEIFEEYKDKVPNLTVRKVELMLKNSFFCMNYHFARLNPMQFGQVIFVPQAKYMALIKSDKFVVPYKNYTKKKRKKEFLERAMTEFEKSLEISD